MIVSRMTQGFRCASISQRDGWILLDVNFLKKGNDCLDDGGHR